jgi:hypothetical protein
MKFKKLPNSRGEEIEGPYFLLQMFSMMKGGTFMKVGTKKFLMQF